MAEIAGKAPGGPDTAGPRRARKASDKLARRQQILAVAETLFLAGDGSLPSAQAIAAAVGLAKGTLYLYFPSLEEIFLALLGEHFRRWMKAAQAELEARGAALTPADIAAAQAAYPLAHPIVMRLAALSSAQLEHGQAEAAVREFKRQLALNLSELGRVIDERLPGLAPGQGAVASLGAYAIIIGLWQVATPPPVTAEILASDALPLRLDFAAELPRMLLAHWRGVLQGVKAI